MKIEKNRLVSSVLCNKTFNTKGKGPPLSYHQNQHQTMSTVSAISTGLSQRGSSSIHDTKRSVFISLGRNLLQLLRYFRKHSKSQNFKTILEYRQYGSFMSFPLITSATPLVSTSNINLGVHIVCVWSHNHIVRSMGNNLTRYLTITSPLL